MNPKVVHLARMPLDLLDLDRREPLRCVTELNDAAILML